MAFFQNFVRGLGQQNAPFGFDAMPMAGSPNQYDPAFQSGLQFIGNVGMGMLANSDKNPLEAFGRSYLGAQEQSREQNRNQFVAAEMLSAAEEKKRKRQEEEEAKAQREAFLKTLPPDVQMKAKSIPGYLDSYIEATDPNLQQPEKPGLHEVNGKLVDDYGNVVYDGGGSGNAPTTKTIYDPETGQEQVVQWNGTDWTPLGGKKSNQDNRATATDKKELWKSEDEIPVLDNTIASLDRALELNDKTLTGYTAGIRGSIGTKMWGGDYLVDKDAATATEEWGKIMSMEAIQNMASTLKGATTDQELNRFVSMLADPTTPPAIRKNIITRMKTLAERVKSIKMQRIKELRNTNSGGATQPVVTEDGYTIEAVPEN